MLALAIGTLLVVLALAYVLYPLVFATAGSSLRTTPRVTAVPASGDEDAIVALREIEFDRATGKLSDADYADLKARYTQRALDAMRAGGVAPAGRACRGRGGSGGSRLSRALAELRALRSASGTGRDLLLQLRHVPRREVRGVWAHRRGAGGGVLRRLRATVGRVGYFSSNGAERASSSVPTWPASVNR